VAPSRIAPRRAVGPFMTIGEFGAITRLSPKALRLYEQLGLVVPAAVDPSSGYRRYAASQVDEAKLVGLLRRLDMPLATIGGLLGMGPRRAAQALEEYWAGVEIAATERRALVSYLLARLRGEPTPLYDVATRTQPARQLLTLARHVHLDGTDAFFADAFSRLRAAAPGLEGIAGVPFLVFYGEVSADSDGPIELCRPVSVDTSPDVVAASPDIQLRMEPAHEEAYVRLTLEEMSWPEMLPAYDTLTQWATEHHRQTSGAPRQLLIADRRTADPDTPVSDLTIPLR
jgi:DNA-binding transcriptional MerR regulator